MEDTDHIKKNWFNKLINEAFIKLVTQQGISIPVKQFIKLYTIDDIKKLDQKNSKEILFKLLFTKDAHEYPEPDIDVSYLSNDDVSTYFFFWAYYKVYGPVEKISKIIRDKPLKIMFLFDSLIRHIVKPYPDDDNREEEIYIDHDTFADDFCVLVGKNQVRKDVFELMDERLDLSYNFVFDVLIALRDSFEDDDNDSFGKLLYKLENE